MDFFFKKQATHKIFKIHYLAEHAKRIWTNIRKKNHTCSRWAQMAFRLLTYIKKVNNETTRRVQELDGVYLQSLSRIRRLSFVWQGVTISYLSTLLLFVFKIFFGYKRVVCFTQKSYSWTDNKTKQIYFYGKPCQGERDFAN